MQKIRLGLIGDNIDASRAPHLHRAAGRLCGLDVSYDLLVPQAMGLNFGAVFDRARDEGYRGVNITYPYKEQVIPRLTIADPSVRAIGACNTALFEGARPQGANTDHTGFISAYREMFGPVAPGKVAIAGSGGVARAIVFALVKLRADAITLFDIERTKADALVGALTAHCPGFAIRAVDTIEDACDGADGLLNCTPAGMVGYGGNAFSGNSYRGHRWAFDAVYTPLETPFVREARVAGLALLSGYELYFWQGVDAFRLFTQHEVDAAALREAIKPEMGE